MPNPFIALTGLCFQKKSKRTGGRGGESLARRFSQPPVAPLFVPIVFARLAS